jgi:hypothetical protein
LGCLVGSDGLFQILKSELQLVSTQLIGPAAKLVACQARISSRSLSFSACSSLAAAWVFYADLPSSRQHALRAFRQVARKNTVLSLTIKANHCIITLDIIIQIQIIF